MDKNKYKRRIRVVRKYERMTCEQRRSEFFCGRRDDKNRGERGRPEGQSVPKTTLQHKYTEIFRMVLMKNSTRAQ
ncbi:hypothetical protein E2C01_013857 [Portunus trituberculatus]|uniref:Uncharacterized protein n=1 Tax=Portunus trituberculatus TaxID=210409 RepID=A0A5B7DIH1_PORTR|nr:hypothetical protein [Portunus trituberculatus]